MRKIFILSLVMILGMTVLNGMVTLAEESLSQWMDSESMPVEMEDGIKFSATELGKLTYAVYKTSLDAKNITVESTPQYCENKTDNDAWIAVNFLSVPEIFNLSDPAKSPGLVALYYNYNGTFRLNLDGYGKGIYEQRNSWRLLEKGSPLEVGKRNTIELKWNDQQKIFNLFVNGKLMDDQGQLAMAKPEIVFPENKAYVVVASYAGGGKPAEYIIHRINDTYFGTNPNKAGSDASATNSQTNETSDTNSSNTGTSNNSENTSAEDSNETAPVQENTAADTDSFAKDTEDDTNNNIPIFAAGTIIIIVAALAIVLFIRHKSRKA